MGRMVEGMRAGPIRKELVAERMTDKTCFLGGFCHGHVWQELQRIRSLRIGGEVLSYLNTAGLSFLLFWSEISPRV